MTKTKEDFGVRVKELREQLHLTQEAMAETLGVSFATVNRWENGWAVPSKLVLRRKSKVSATVLILVNSRFQNILKFLFEYRTSVVSRDRIPLGVRS